MSILRSKHSGWTFEGKRTPYFDGGVIEGAILGEALGTGIAAEGAATGLGGFGALNLAGNSAASLLSPEVAALGGGSYFSPLAGLTGGSGLTSLGALGEGILPYSGLIPEAGVSSVFPLAESASAAPSVPGGEMTYSAPIDQVQYNTPASAPTVPKAPDIGIPSWLKSMYTDKQGNFDPLKAGMYGLGGMTAFNLLTGRGNNYMTPYKPPTAASYGLNRNLAANYQPIRMAGGGIADLKVGPSSVASGGVAPAGLLASAPEQSITMQDVQDLAGQYGYQLPPGMADGGIAGLSANPNFPMAQQQAPRYAVASQMPVGASDVRMASLPPTPMARGGIADLGGYSDGGRMLKGPGDGMSDSIPASISGKQPARLADGEFVVPADVVSHLGNGSTDAGAKQLYKMMDKVRTARTGRKAQGRQINPKKYVPA